MNVTVAYKSLSELDDDVLIVPAFEGETPKDGMLASLDHLTVGAISQVYETGEMEGKSGTWSYLHSTGALNARRLLLYGAGDPRKSSYLSIQRLAGAALKLAAARGASSAAVLLREQFDSRWGASALVEGAILGQMNGGIYCSREGEPEREVKSLRLVSESAGATGLEAAVERGRVMGEATNFARLLGYEPGNILTPTELANRAAEMARREGLSVEVLGEDEMKRLGMGALLAVSRGSEEPARLIVMDYKPAEPDQVSTSEVIALVGKGITFDSGGISIKPGLHMEDMKYDMGGGAAVIGAMEAIARLKPGVRVLGIVPASENLPSGRAVKPGDVVRSMSGKTIEVVNTDAEGRLVLADAMTHAINLGATRMIDAATLTGAVVVALGSVRAAVIGSDQQLVDALVRAGDECGERLWQLPLDSEYASLIRSDIADMKNVGDRTAGTISAAMFLKNFAGTLPWAHLDIAGTAWLEQEKPYQAKGATGFGVRVLASFVLNFAEEARSGQAERE